MGSYIEIKDTDVESVIWRIIICRFSVPQEVMMDNGSQFISGNFKKFFIRWKIELSFSTPRYPQDNRQAEVTKRMIV